MVKLTRRPGGLSWGDGGRLGALWFAIHLLACAPQPEAPAVTPVVEVAVVPPVVDLAISVAAAPADLPRSTEIAGLVTAMVELGASDLAAVVPRVGAGAGQPGLDLALEAGSVAGTLTLSLTGSADALRLGGRVCVADRCTDLSSETAGSSSDPAPAVGAFLRALSSAVGRPPARDAERAWSVAESSDPYAALIAGRAAATAYGTLPATPPDALWDKRRDVFRRALYIDPKMPVAGWLAGRRAMALGDAARAREFAAYAMSWRGDSVALRALVAAAEARLDREEAAWDGWRALMDRTGTDVRFVVPYVHAALAVHAPEAAERALDDLPERHATEPRVAAARVAIHEAGGDNADYDALLAAWQASDPTDPVPVRKRLGLRVAASLWDEALAFTEALAQRGAKDEADRASLAVLLALGRPSEAADRADAIGDGAAASRLRALSLGDDEARSGALVGDAGVWARIWRARRELAAGRPAAALAVSVEILALRPGFPEALALKADAEDRLGDGRAAASTRQLLASVLPLGPRGAP
jgi:hypothetical protein